MILDDDFITYLLWCLRMKQHLENQSEFNEIMGKRLLASCLIYSSQQHGFWDSLYIRFLVLNFSTITVSHQTQSSYPWTSPRIEICKISSQKITKAATINRFLFNCQTVLERFNTVGQNPQVCPIFLWSHNNKIKT